MRIALYTLGCKLNQCETEAIASILKQSGYTLVPIKQKADLCIINTCTVTTKSEQKARRIIRACIKQKNDTIIIVTGCYSQLNPEKISVLGDTTIVIPQDNKDRLIDFFTQTDRTDFELLSPFEQKQLINEFIKEKQNQPYNPFIFISHTFQFHSRAFLKIQDGCNCRCTYCRVPLARGNSVSLDPGEVIKRIEEIKNAGYREIVLTGVNISAYNHSGLGLHELLKEIISTQTLSSPHTQQGGKKIRFRLSSLEPEFIDEKLARIITHPIICPHFHIPVQSGSNKILHAMKRRYTADQVKYAVRLLKQAKPGCFLGADILTGFPGETDSDYQLTLNLIKDCGFSKLHAFRFSPRPGTPAFLMKPKVLGKTVKDRLSGLLHLSDTLFLDYRTRWEGKNIEIILEKKIETGDNRISIWQGLSGNYLPFIVTRIPKKSAFSGNLVRCYVEKAEKYGIAAYISDT